MGGGIQSKGSRVTINAHCANAWATLNKLPIQKPTFDCHVFNSKLEDYPKERMDQIGWGHAAIPYRDSNPYPHPNSALSKATISPFLFLAPLTEHHTLLQDFPCSPDLPPSNMHIPVLITSIFYPKHAHNKRQLLLFPIHTIPLSWTQYCLATLYNLSCSPSAAHSSEHHYRSEQSTSTYLNQGHGNQSSQCNSISIKVVIFWSFIGS